MLGQVPEPPTISPSLLMLDAIDFCLPCAAHRECFYLIVVLRAPVYHAVLLASSTFRALDADWRAPLL